MTDYEDVLSTLSAVPSAAGSGVRDIVWITDTRVLGVARDQESRLELFLAGEELKPSSAAIQEALEHHDWHRESGAPLAANRLLLPALGHYDPIAAFICTELLRNNADEDLEQAFRATEPIIEIAVKRLEMAETAMLGLIGELMVLNALCNQVESHQLGDVVQSWFGWRRSARDFWLNGTGVEVKATTRSVSSHIVQGVHQVEPGQERNDELAEDRLILVSVGLQRAAPGANAVSIPSLLQRIIGRLEAEGYENMVSDLVARIKLYGTELGFGYDHNVMSNDAPFISAFSITFFRGYDMADPAIKVLRRDEVAVHSHVELQSVRFRINLPSEVSGLNPIAGANQVARRILGM